VKHLADEILKNHKFMRDIHSNNSLRKILETEAKKHLDASNYNNLFWSLFKKLILLLNLRKILETEAKKHLDASNYNNLFWSLFKKLILLLNLFNNAQKTV
jgi:hypothetical protein